MDLINSRELIKKEKKDKKYLGKIELFKIIKKDRDDNLIIKLKCNGYKSIKLTLTNIIQINLNKKVKLCTIKYKEIIKDATIDYNIKFFSLEIWEIFTLDYDKEFQKKNEEILIDYISSNLNIDILKMRFMDYIKSDYLLSNKEYNRKYKFCDDFINKYLFENKFNDRQKINAKKLIKQDLLRHLKNKYKRKIENEKYEFKSSQKILQLLNENTREKTNYIYNEDTINEIITFDNKEDNNFRDKDFEVKQNSEIMSKNLCDILYYDEDKLFQEENNSNSYYI